MHGVRRLIRVNGASGVSTMGYEPFGFGQHLIPMLYLFAVSRIAGSLSRPNRRGRMEAMKTVAILLVLLVVSLTKASNSKKIKHCNKKCVLLVNNARQLRTLGINLSSPNRKLSKYCRSTNISNDQCANIIKLSQDLQLTQQAVCLQSGICQKEDQPNRTPCPICDAIESNIKRPIKQYSRKTADVKRLVSDICRTSTTPSLKAQCERLQPRLGIFGDNILRLFKPSTCRQIMCNTLTKKVMRLFPNNPLACRICQTSATATTKGIKAISNVFDVVLSDVSALCKDFNSTAVSIKCRKVTESIDRIVNYVVKQLNFDDICVKLDICPGGDKAQSPMFNILQSVVMAEPAEKESCPVCETFLDDNNDALGKLKVNMKKISEFTAQTCNKQGNKSMKSRCDLLQQMKSATDTRSFRKTCRMLMCSNVANLVKLIAPTFEACPLCKAIQKIVTDSFKQGTKLMDTITSELSVICEDLKNEAARKTCYYSFNMTLKATDYIMSKFNFSNFCVVAGVCTKDRITPNRGHWLTQALSMKDRFMTFLAMVSPSPKRCSACDMMSGSINHMKIQFNEKVAEIKSTLDKSCEAESTVIQAKCSVLKADLERSIRKQIPFVSGEACSKYLCNNLVKRMMGRLRKDSKTCDLCRNIVKTATDGIKAGFHISDTFIEDLRPMCKEIKLRKGKQECEKSLSLYNNVYGFFVKKIDLSSACTLIGLCPKEKLPIKSLPDTSPADKCAVCTKMESLTGPEFQKFRNKLESLKTLVSGLCTGSGKPRIDAECWGLSFLTRILEKSVAPQFTKQGCRKNLCQGALAKLPKSAKACQICKEVVKISSISLKSFQTMFLGILQGVDEAVCSELNNTAASALCHKIVGDIKTILDLVIKQLSPAGFCEEVGICPKKMIGRNQCEVCKTVYEVNSQEMSYENLLSTCQRLGAQECEEIARNFKLLGAAKRFHLSSKVACQRVSLCKKTDVMGIVSKILNKVGSFGSWFSG
eukprot:Seg440.8 transcript_id=Seg440.8/GoldUCD/mRNA.D3Y31 product="hypothetical protein" protein_id=Seg440.8/GoldUCD/D3Y31